MAGAIAAAGWHGKLPTIGDFATRRLQDDFIMPWDDWISRGLQPLKQCDGGIDAYLRSPSWRFLLLPGALPGTPGTQAWAGILMPSVDRVGRYYPFTLAHPLSFWPASGADQERLCRWLERLDKAAVDALHLDWSIDVLEAELQHIGLPETAQDPLRPGQDIEELAAKSFSDAAAQVAAWLASTGGQGMYDGAFWYSESETSPPRLIRSTRGLDDRLIAVLLGGQQSPVPA